MQFGVCLEGVVERDEERGLSDGLQDLSLRLRMLQGLLLLDDGGLLQHFHGIQLATVMATQLAHQKHFAIGWKTTTTSLQRHFYLNFHFFQILSLKGDIPFLEKIKHQSIKFLRVKGRVAEKGCSTISDSRYFKIWEFCKSYDMKKDSPHEPSHHIGVDLAW